MNIGKLNRRVTIKYPSETQDAVGQPVIGFTTLAQSWANIRYLNGSEAIKASAEASTVKASIRIRRRTDVTAKMLVDLGATTFRILAVLPDEQDRKYIYLVCEVIA